MKRIRLTTVLAALLVGASVTGCAKPDDLRAKRGETPNFFEQTPGAPDGSPLASDDPNPGTVAPTVPAARPVLREITSDVPIDNDGKVTCPAKVYLSYVSGGGTAGSILAATSLSATCTDSARMPIDASGDFDGAVFSLKSGRWTWSGSLTADVVTLTGGPGNVTFVFPAP